MISVATYAYNGKMYRRSVKLRGVVEWHVADTTPPYEWVKVTDTALYVQLEEFVSKGLVFN